MTFFKSYVIFNLQNRLTILIGLYLPNASSLKINIQVSFELIILSS